MITRVLIVRHGDSFHRHERIVGAEKGCRGLTPEGREQVEALARRLASGVPPSCVFVSPYPRALQTAQILSERLGLPEPEIHRGLSSWIVPPEIDGIPSQELQTRYAVPAGSVYQPLESVSESWAELVIRVSRALWEIAGRRKGETILVASHAEAVNASLCAFGSLPLNLPFDTVIANASLTEWTTEMDPEARPFARWTLVGFNR